MLSNLKNIWKVPDLRNKVAFTILVIAIYELGANIITPYISPNAVAQLESSGEAGGDPRLPEPLLRKRPPAHGGVRARDHALHHELDHHPAAVDRDPETGGVARPGRPRPEEADPDDPVPDARARAACNPRVSSISSTTVHRAFSGRSAPTST